MNEINRNTRTLIVSFVVAIMVLTPLRFVEVGQMVGESQVLGDVDTQVVLPEIDLEVVNEEPVLEAPYNEIESMAVLGEETVVVRDCITTEESQLMITDLQSQIDGMELNGEQWNEVITQLVSIEENTCK
jgi:hypothetical protein